MRRHIAGRLLIPLAIAGSPGCAAKAPQTRAEFVAAAEHGAHHAVHERVVISRPYAAVLESLESRVPQCFDQVVNRFLSDPTQRSTFTYAGTLSRTTNGDAELTLQVAPFPREPEPRMPQGGFFLVAANLRELDQDRTELLSYHPRAHYAAVVGAIKAWASSGPEAAPCPPLEH